MGRNKQIEGLRGIAMVIVVCYHLIFGYLKHYGTPIENNFLGIKYWGYFGVSIFILISGYFSQGENSIIRTIIKKVSRLWPAYVVAVFVIYITTTMFQLEGRTVSKLGFLANCLMLNGFIGIGYVDGAHWYITTLISCVIVSSALNKIKEPLKSICVVCWNIGVVFLSISIPSNRLLYLFRSELLVLMGGGTPLCLQQGTVCAC